MNAPVQVDHGVGLHTDSHRRRRAAVGRSRQIGRARELPGAYAKPARLASYRDGCGRRRDLVALRGHAGSVLVIDRDAATLRDRLLLAHLAADEPPGNAELVCRDYLSCRRRGRPRPLLPGDLLTRPLRQAQEPGRSAGEGASIAVHGCSHRLCRVRGAGGRPELRWARAPAPSADVVEAVGLRELIGALESYEPVRTITAAAIDRHRRDRDVSVRHLQGEYRWLSTSPMVLNRALREAVLRATESGQLTMSEIALRCGILKRDGRGGLSGESSWLARRVGLMPEGGATRLTPWIHSDVLAVIARDGLRVSPRDVEVP